MKGDEFRKDSGDILPIVVDQAAKTQWFPLHISGLPRRQISAVSLTHRYRITRTLLITDKEIILLDVGSHDEA